jgi:hypothetical protein
MAWCRTWVLADKLGCSNISTHVNTEYCAYLSKLPLDERMIPPAAAQYLYENTSEPCELRETLERVAVITYQAFDCCCEDRMRRWSESAASYPKYLSEIMGIAQEQAPLESTNQGCLRLRLQEASEVKGCTNYSHL